MSMYAHFSFSKVTQITDKHFTQQLDNKIIKTIKQRDNSPWIPTFDSLSIIPFSTHT